MGAKIKRVQAQPAPFCIDCSPYLSWNSGGVTITAPEL